MRLWFIFYLFSINKNLWLFSFMICTMNFKIFHFCIQHFYFSIHLIHAFYVIISELLLFFWHCEFLITSILLLCFGWNDIHIGSSDSERKRCFCCSKRKREEVALCVCRRISIFVYISPIYVCKCICVSQYNTRRQLNY